MNTEQSESINEARLLKEKAYHPVSHCDRQLAPEIEEDLKLKINNLVWALAPEDITLGQAENLAYSIWRGIIQGRLDVPEKPSPQQKK